MKKIGRDTERDYYMDAREAVKYGVIDEIMVSRNPAVKTGKE